MPEDFFGIAWRLALVIALGAVALSFGTARQPDDADTCVKVGEVLVLGCR